MFKEVLLIFLDINDEVILSPSEPTEKQSIYFLANFLEDLGCIRVHAMEYDALHELNGKSR